MRSKENYTIRLTKNVSAILLTKIQPVLRNVELYRLKCVHVQWKWHHTYLTADTLVCNRVPTYYYHCYSFTIISITYSQCEKVTACFPPTRMSHTRGRRSSSHHRIVSLWKAQGPIGTDNNYSLPSLCSSLPTTATVIYEKTNIRRLPLQMDTCLASFQTLFVTLELPNAIITQLPWIDTKKIDKRD